LIVFFRRLLVDI